MPHRLLALAAGTLVAVLAGSALLFLAGLSRDDVAKVLDSLLAPASAATLPQQEDRAPCDIEPPPPAQRAFDRATLVVASSVTAEAEAEALRGRLGEAEQALRDGDLWSVFKIEEQLDQRRTLFTTRFGRRLADTAAGKAMEGDAAGLLARIERSDLAAGDPATDSYSALFRVLLLDLAGRGDEATATLAKVRASHWCGNCAAERQGKLQERRSEAAERRGDAAAALAFLEEARRSVFGFPAPPRDITDARHGLLMLEAGQDFFGTCLLQRVVDIFPATAGAEVARAALEQVGSFREPEPQRIRRMYVDGREPNDPMRKLAEAALAGR